jgi:hypothetical protein
MTLSIWSYTNFKSNESNFLLLNWI